MKYNITYQHAPLHAPTKKNTVGLVIKTTRCFRIQYHVLPSDIQKNLNIIFRNDIKE